MRLTWIDTNLIFILIFLLGCKSGGQNAKIDLDIHPDVGERLAQYAPVEITADISFLPENEQKALTKLIEASRPLDDIFLRQVWVQNPEYLQALQARTDELGQEALAYFKINFGPWDRLQDDEPFIGNIKKPAGAGFYPPNMTKEDFENFVKAHPEEKQAMTSLYTVIRRKGGELVPVLYSDEYFPWLENSADGLREAAKLTQNASLKEFLETRADAFFSNDYYASDLAWMDVNSPIEVTIGPYEVYEDKLYGYKASFESFVTVVNPGESEKLARYKSELPAMEKNLPIPDAMKNLNRGTESPIRVVEEVYTAGDTRAGVQTIAFNLPNDERVREQKGSKKVLLRNVIAAKYEKILKPIAEKLINPDELQYVSSEAFTNEVLFHELSHGLGPGKITLNGRKTEVRLELKDLYSATEEAKADVMGVYNMHFMIEKGLLPPTMEKQIAVTYLAGLFRSVRFGIGEAHGKGTALQFNYLMEKGAFAYDNASGTYSVHFDVFANAIRDLVHDITVLQAKGDYAGTRELLQKYAQMPDLLRNSLDKIKDVPVDIVPRYTLARQLMGTSNTF